jgi:protein phosphatase 1G
VSEEGAESMFEKAESDIIAIGTGCTACVALIT